MTVPVGPGQVLLLLLGSVKEKSRATSMNSSMHLRKVFGLHTYRNWSALDVGAGSLPACVVVLRDPVTALSDKNIFRHGAEGSGQDKVPDGS